MITIGSTLYEFQFIKDAATATGDAVVLRGRVQSERNWRNLGRERVSGQPNLVVGGEKAAWHLEG